MDIETKLKWLDFNSWYGLYPVDRGRIIKGNCILKVEENLRRNSMTTEEAIEYLKRADSTVGRTVQTKTAEALEIAIEALEKDPCEMTVEEYRQRMIQAFHNADTDELIAVCVLPTEKEFEHLEWLLKNHYKKEPVLDKIIAEVKSIEINRDDYSQKQNDYCDGCAFTIKQVLRIIDKYKVEKE